MRVYLGGEYLCNGPEGQELPIQTFVLNLPIEGILVVHKVRTNTLLVGRPMIIFCTILKTVFSISGIFCEIILVNAYRCKIHVRICL